MKIGLSEDRTPISPHDVLYFLLKSEIRAVAMGEILS